MEDRNSFRGFGITDEFVNRFKASMQKFLMFRKQIC